MRLGAGAAAGRAMRGAAGGKGGGGADITTVVASAGIMAPSAEMGSPIGGSAIAVWAEIEAAGALVVWGAGASE